jgi:predicted RecA/RadA family phage recombinase
MPDYKNGAAVMADHTATAAITAGDVISIGNVPAIAHSDIADTELGALAMGGGIYSTIGDAVIAAGVKVWWDGTSKVSETATSSDHFGFTVSACAADAGAVDVMHNPGGTNGS